MLPRKAELMSKWTSLPCRGRSINCQRTSYIAHTFTLYEWAIKGWFADETSYSYNKIEQAASV